MKAAGLYQCHDVKVFFPPGLCSILMPQAAPEPISFVMQSRTQANIYRGGSYIRSQNTAAQLVC